MSETERIAALETELAALRAEIAALRSAVAAPAAGPRERAAGPRERAAGPDEPAAAATTGDPGGAADETRATRRSVLRSAAVAAGAVAAGAAAAAGSVTPVAAANGDAVAAGQITTSSAKTELRYNSSSPIQSHLLAVQDGAIDLGFVIVPSAILGLALGKVANGVVGTTNVADGAGVIATGDNARSRGLLVRGKKSAISIANDGPPPQDRNAVGSFVPGDVVLDTGYTLWMCVGSGATGATASWRRLTAPNAVGSLTLNASPVRAYDSRTTGGRISAGQDRDIQLKTGNGVPDGATAALLNVTVTDTSTAGFLKVYKPGASTPSASNINWDHTGSNVANNATVVLDTEERCRVRCGGTNASTHFIIDVLGWYR